MHKPGYIEVYIVHRTEVHCMVSATLGSSEGKVIVLDKVVVLVVV